MNKIAIPALLVATIMVAGAFAFMPVEQASTVHATVIDSSARIVVVASNNCEMAAAGSTNDCNNYAVTIPAGTDGVLLSTLVVFDENPAGNAAQVDFSVLTINGAATTVDPSGTLAADTTVNVSGLNWGIQGAGATTITAVNTNVLTTDGGESSFVQITLFMLVEGTTTGLSALLD